MGNNPNPLDACTRDRMQCDNPCKHEKGTCPELLPTQLDTFVTQFFGSVGKSNVGGQVSWSLPCGLDTGIAANPRQPGESLACYFLRLLEAGLTGVTGQTGQDGVQGPTGPDAFSYTLQDFSQPTLPAPYITILLNPSASLVQGLYYQIEYSGWYQLLSIGTDGTAQLALIQAVPNPPAIVPSGSIVVASGMPGIRVQGPAGPQGPQGPRGPRGVQGAAGITGSAGGAGPIIRLPGGYQYSPAGYTNLMNGTYQDWPNSGPIFQPPVLSVNATYFMVFACNVMLANSEAPESITNSIWTQLVKFIGMFGGAIPQTERCFTLAGFTLTGSQTAMVYIPLIDTVLAGQSVLYIPASKSDATFPIGGYINSGYSVVNWCRIQ